MRLTIETVLFVTGVLLLTFCKSDAVAVIKVNETRPDADKIECPAFSVCADMWNVWRQLEDGNEVPEERVIYNCKCPNDGRCDGLVVRDTVKHSYVFCEQPSEFHTCDTTMSRNGKIIPEIAEQTIHGYYMGRQYNYIKLHCICPRHSDPATGLFNRAVTRYYGDLPAGISSRNLNYVCA
ncbi:hypothetical protein CHS0354_021478 [Potamilus streckersoni]|nr:hypothetical protein CHS0354_021478 [Potamilus streckersoni]